MTAVAAKPNLFLLHGWGMNPGVWGPVVEPLGAHFRVHAPPLAGLANDAPAPGNLTDLAHSMLDQAPQEAVWVGWSLGGMVALEAALAAPERITGLMLVASTPKFIAGDGWAHGTDHSLMRRFCAELQQDYAKAMTRFLLLQAGRINGARILARRIGAEVAAWGTVSPAALDAGLDLLAAVDLRSRLGEVSVPTSVLHGELDRVTPPAAGRYLAEQIPAASFSLQHVGHAPFVSLPGEFVDLVRQL